MSVGTLAALGSAAAWAWGAILFRRLGERVSPFGMNLGKGLLGIALLGAVLAWTGFPALAPRDMLLLGASGVLGIALADTLYFQALVLLGPRRTVLLETLGPALTALLSVLLLRERPAPLSCLGMPLVLGGVGWVLLERSHAPDRTKADGLGLAYGLASMLCMAVSTVAAKVALASAPSLAATFVRLLCAVAALLIWGACRGGIGTSLAPFKSPSVLRRALWAGAVVIFGGFWLSMLALEHLPASVAAVLGSTTPLFILPLTALLLGERVTTRAASGAVVAVVGAALILSGR